MKKSLLIFVIFTSILSSLKSQTFYKNSLIEMGAYFNTKDNSIYLRIKNISDSVLVLNDKEINYIRIRENYVTNLSLVSNGVSLLQPGSCDLMYFKRLLPKSTYTITIDKGDTSVFNINTFKLLIEIQYLVIPPNIFIKDNILNRNLIEFIRKEKLNLHYFDGMLKMDENIHDCLNVLRIE